MLDGDIGAWEALVLISGMIFAYLTVRLFTRRR